MSSHDQATSQASRSPSSEYAASSYSLPAASDAPMHSSRVTPLHRWALNASDSQFNAISGAVGGFTSGVVTCPLDVIKTKLQAQGGYAALNRGRHVGHPKLYNGLIGSAKVIWREEGIRGLYRGLGPIVMGYLPTWAVYFTVYNKSKGWLSQHYDNSHLVNLWSSITAGASSTIVTNPIWVIKTRLMSQSSVRHSHDHTSLYPKAGSTPTSRPTLHDWHYRSTIDAARKMYTSEGIISFYSGLTPALLGLSHVAVQFPTYEYLKTKFTGHSMGESGEGEKANVVGILSASILSKIVASSATYPHEVIRTRLQTQRRPLAGEEVPRTPAQPPKYQGVIHTFQTILREEGWRAFYAGLGTNMMRAVPAATVTLLTYETVMSELLKTRAEARHLLLDSRTEP
ncbi:mitochondrial carrier domain-containing protein [Fusarium solani]|uniref:Mitochondrial carrier domain-containing protein n=1 Tax=Fusarium solani TaxID=169388 RepID=A0A9P9HZ28_FUSSL|nr:mitochondrial carrier domain-containing protein [Fusarium solani]KAH7266165.1 mitochondrial carrier domain-containing protein [Fusarium solani]